MSARSQSYLQDICFIGTIEEIIEHLLDLKEKYKYLEKIEIGQENDGSYYIYDVNKYKMIEEEEFKMRLEKFRLEHIKKSLQEERDLYEKLKKKYEVKK